MVEKNQIPNGHLSLERVAEMLCTKEFSVKDASAKGSLPKIVFKKNNAYFKEQELAKHFGLDTFDEPFIKVTDVIEMTELSAAQIKTAYAAELNPLPSYQLVQAQGSHRLFLESQVKEWFEIKLHQDVAHGVFANKYKMLIDTFEDTLNACWDLGKIKYKEYLVVHAVLVENKTLEQIRETNRPRLEVLMATEEFTEAARLEFAENHLDPTLTSVRINQFLTLGFRAVKHFTANMTKAMEKYEELESLVARQTLMLQEKDQIFEALNIDASMLIKKLRGMLELGERELNSLKSIGIITLGQLAQVSREELSKIPLFVEKSFEKVNKVMVNHGYPEK